MLEFGVRILVAGAAILYAGTTGGIGFSFAVGIAMAIGLLAVAGYALDTKELYDGSAAGLHAALDGFVIALFLTDLGKAESLGFLTLIPYGWAASNRKAPWAPGAFAAVFALVGGEAILHRSDPSPILILQCAGVLLLGLSVSMPAPVAAIIPAEAFRGVDEHDLKGRFRALKEAYSMLERRSKDDAHSAAIIKAVTPDALAQSLRDATSATGAALFVPGEEGWELLGSAGQYPDDLKGPPRSARELQQKGAVMLFSGGRPVGAVWMPDEARDGIAGVSETLSLRFSERLEVEYERRRRQAAELRIVLIEGGDSPDSVAHALAATIGADSVEFGVVGPLGATPLGHFGPPCGLPEAMRHESGPGLAGWASAGSPLVWIGDARQDRRVDEVESLRARTASLALVPLAEGRAYVWAAWHTAGAGRPTSITAMRAAEPVVVRWLAQATGRTFKVTDRLAA